MNSDSFPNSQPRTGNIGSKLVGGTSYNYRCYQQPQATNLHVPALSSSQHSSHNPQAIAPLICVHQQHQPHDHSNTPTSSTTVPPTSNFSQVAQNPPQPHQNHTPASVNHVHCHDPNVQPKQPSMNPSQVASTSASVSATLAPVQALFQNVWTETQNQVTLTHAYYDKLLGEERTKAAEQLQQANAQAFAAMAQVDHYLIQCRAMQTKNSQLLKEIQSLHGEGTKLRRWVETEKEEVESQNGEIEKQNRELRSQNGELEKQNRTLMKVMQTQADDMQKLRDEWNVAQAVRVNLHAQNQRLTKEVEETKNQLSKIENSFEEKIRAEFEIRLARVFADEQRRKIKHDNNLPPQEEPTIVKTEDLVIKIEDE